MMLKGKERTKPYLMPDLEKRITLELKVDHSNKGLYVVRVFLDEQLLFNIWCDRIAVSPTRPPIYSLYCGNINILGLTAKMVTLSEEANANIILPDEMMAKLGKYIQIESKERG